MSRRLYRQMAQSRAALNRRSGDTFDYVAYKRQQEVDAAKMPPAILSEPPARIHHPVLKAPQRKCYRALRFWKGEAYGEDIGFGTKDQALAILRRELGWAIVVDPNGKRIAYNWQPLEVRDATAHAEVMDRR